MKYSISVLLIILFLSSCATKKVSHSSLSFADTTHVVIADTTHVFHQHDTTVVTVNEVIREKIVTLYDPITGQPSRQEIERDIQKLYDSIYVHRLDSMYNAIHSSLSNANNTTFEQSHEQASGDSALSAAKILMRKFSTIFVLIIISFAICLAIRYVRPR